MNARKSAPGYGSSDAQGHVELKSACNGGPGADVRHIVGKRGLRGAGVGEKQLEIAQRSVLVVLQQAGGREPLRLVVGQEVKNGDAAYLCMEHIQQFTASGCARPW